MDQLLRRVDAFLKVALVVGLCLIGFLSARSAILAAKRANVLEEQLTDLQTSYQSLRYEALACYDELAWRRKRAARAAASPAKAKK